MKLSAIPKVFFGIFQRIFAGVKDTALRLVELREVGRIEKQRTIPVKYPDRNNILCTTQGKLTQNLEWVYLPMFRRVQKVDIIYKDERLKPFIVTSLNAHKTLNLEELNEGTLEFYNQAKNINDKLIIKLGKKDLRHIEVTTDLTAKDNPIAQEFSIDADRVFQTKSLEILEEPARRTIVIAAIFGVLIGMMLAFFIGYALLLWLG